MVPAEKVNDASLTARFGQRSRGLSFCLRSR
jgi:hypothetical protein